MPGPMSTPVPRQEPARSSTGLALRAGESIDAGHRRALRVRASPNQLRPGEGLNQSASTWREAQPIGDAHAQEGSVRAQTAGCHPC